MQYQGRTLHFTPAYIQGLAEAFRSGAYDQVSFQLADSANSHTNDPERHRGTIVDMKAQADGLYVMLQPTERGEQVLRENPYLGVSARIVEQYQRSDGAFYPAAIQHVLGTLDPRIPNLGQWEPVDMSNGSDSAITIDLSNYSFAGEPAPGAALPGLDELSDEELADLIDVLDEVGLLDGGYDDGGELDDDELEALMQAAEDGDPDAFSEFGETFSARAQAEQARQDARAAAIVEDTIGPRLRREEDRIARTFSRAAAGVYDGQQLDFASESAAIELAVATGRGNCGPADEYGRCSSRYHDLGCSADATAVELTGPKGYSHGWVKEALGLGSATEAAARGAGLPLEPGDLPPHQQRAYRKMRAIGHPHSRALAFARRAGAAAGRGLGVGEATRVFNQANTVHGDPDDLDEPWYEVPQGTIELAHELAIDWGLDGTPGDPARRRTLTCCGHRPSRSASRMRCTGRWATPARPSPRPGHLTPASARSARNWGSEMSQPEPRPSRW